MKIKTARKKFIKSKIEKCPIDLILVAMENILEKLQLCNSPQIQKYHFGGQNLSRSRQ